MEYHFEWDWEKARTNLSKHGVSFELASEVFKDPMALTLFDGDNTSDIEERWVTLGQVRGHLYLVVVHTFRDEQADQITIRLISARPATKHETKQYQGG